MVEPQLEHDLSISNIVILATNLDESQRPTKANISPLVQYDIIQPANVGTITTCQLTELTFVDLIFLLLAKLHPHRWLILIRGWFNNRSGHIPIF